MKNTLLVFTDGRGELLQRTVESFNQNVDGAIHTRLMMDDSGDTAYGHWLDDSFGKQFRITHHPRRMGFTGTIGYAWAELPMCDWIFHLEDDFTFNRPIKLADIIDVLTNYSYLAQMVFKRQPWNDVEKKAGDIIRLNPDAYTQEQDGLYHWVEHHLNFSTNPCVYPYYVTRWGWPQVKGSEGRFSRKLVDMGYRFAYWGEKFDPPLVEHIGYERIGNGY